jgi:isoamylase
MIKFRVRHPLLGRTEFLTNSDITWHESNWDDEESKFLAFTLHDCGQGGGSLYIALNSHHFDVNVGLPPPPEGKKWSRVVDTNLPSPRDMTPEGNSGVEGNYNIVAYSSIILMAK